MGWEEPGYIEACNNGAGSLNVKSIFFSLFILDLYSFYFLFYLFFYFILLDNTVLVLPYIDLNPPWVYMRSQT